MVRYEDGMSNVAAIYHRTKEVNIYPIEGDRFLVEAFLQDEIHDVHAEVEILHPSLEIVAARSEVRKGPFTNVCNMTHPKRRLDRAGVRRERPQVIAAVTGRSPQTEHCITVDLG